METFPLPEPLPEAWMRGPVSGVDPLTAPVLYAFQQAREDLAKHTEGLGTEQIWATPYGFGSVGFHLRHIAGSTGRLLAYLEGHQLSGEQMAALRAEKEPGATREELLQQMDAAFERAETTVRALDPATLAEPREIGRKRLPTTVIGLLTHIAEHTQRHVGQAIGAAKLARVAREDGLAIVPSRHSADETVNRLQRALEERGVKIFAVIDHSGEAEKAGLRMPNTKLIIFGNPRAGAPLMIAAPTVAIDLPLKILIWEDAEGKVWTGYNSPEFVRERHHLPPALAQALGAVVRLVDDIAH